MHPTAPRRAAPATSKSKLPVAVDRCVQTTLLTHTHTPTMYSPPHHNTRSPPPLQHPIPTHPPRHVPDPPVTPSPQAGASGTSETHLGSARSRAAGGGGATTGGQQTGYVRYSSPPIQDPSAQGGAGYGQSFGSAMNTSYSGGGGGYDGQAQGGNFYPSSQQQQSGQQGGFGNFGNFLPNDPNMNMTAQMGMHFGQQMASVGGEYVQKNVSCVSASGGRLPFPSYPC